MDSTRRSAAHNAVARRRFGATLPGWPARPEHSPRALRGRPTTNAPRSRPAPGASAPWPASMPPRSAENWCGTRHAGSVEPQHAVLEVRARRPGHHAAARPVAPLPGGRPRRPPPVRVARLRHRDDAGGRGASRTTSAATACWCHSSASGGLDAAGRAQGLLQGRGDAAGLRVGAVTLLGSDACPSTQSLGCRMDLGRPRVP